MHYVRKQLDIDIYTFLSGILSAEFILSSSAEFTHIFQTLIDIHKRIDKTVLSTMVCHVQ